MNDDSYIMVTEQQVLERLCQQWQQRPVLVVDTEFMRTDTFYPIPALLQIGDGDKHYLIDPLAIDDTAPLKALFDNEAVIKVLHSCSEDLEVFDCWLGTLPKPLFDTQVAAALVGEGFSVGYANLVKAVLGVELPKGETRSNWLARPLSASQLHYAAQDVIYLWRLYQVLSEKLQQLGRRSWVEQDCAEIIAAAHNKGSEDDQLYLKVKGAWQLTEKELGILQALTQWREQLARDKNMPRNRILKDKQLWEIARKKPHNSGRLKHIDGMHPRSIRQYGDSIVALVEKVSTAPAQSWPARLPKPLPPEAGNLLKRLRGVVAQIAEELNVSQEMLARKKDYEAIVRSGYFGGDYRLPDNLINNWRAELLQQRLLAEAEAFTQAYKLQ